MYTHHIIQIYIIHIYIYIYPDIHEHQLFEDGPFEDVQAPPGLGVTEPTAKPKEALWRQENVVFSWKIMENHGKSWYKWRF